MQSNEVPTSIDGTDIPAPTPPASNGSKAAEIEKDQAKSESSSDKASQSASEAEKAEQAKRFIPEYKKADSALTFPEKVSAVLFSEVADNVPAFHGNLHLLCLVFHSPDDELNESLPERRSGNFLYCMVARWQVLRDSQPR